MKQQRLMKVLLSPRVTEKTVLSSEVDNAYVFKVMKDANKPEIKRAVELMFEVKVDTVRTINLKGKQKRHGMHTGRRPSIKKAIVKLKEGESIELLGIEQ